MSDIADLLPMVGQLARHPELIKRLPADAQNALIARMQSLLTDKKGWPKAFIHRESKRVYKPHTVEESVLVYTDTPRYGAILGGEGSG